MSISGAALRNPRKMRPSRSASAWNLTRIARPLELRNQFRVRLSRLLVLRFSGAEPFRKARIDLVLVCQAECKRTVHLFEGQRGITLDHSLTRLSLAEEIDEGIHGHTRLPHAIR